MVRLESVTFWSSDSALMTTATFCLSLSYNRVKCPMATWPLGHLAPWATQCLESPKNVQKVHCQIFKWFWCFQTHSGPRNTIKVLHLPACYANFLKIEIENCNFIHILRKSSHYHKSFNLMLSRLILAPKYQFFNSVIKFINETPIIPHQH